jgi:hypothetical protein
MHAVDAVHEELEHVTRSLFFRNSDRCLRLLQYLVNTALHGDYNLLNERLIGVKVFGRDPSYNKMKDNIVRMSAAEVRARLVRYYASAEHRSELRIILSPGSYVPQFAWAEEAEQQQYAAENTQSGASRFWSPLVESAEPILIVLGASQFSRPKRLLCANVNCRDEHQEFSAKISLADALTLSRIASYLQSCGKEYRVETEDYVRFRDLRNGPAVFLGGLNNQWTMSFAEHLRFAFKTNRGHTRSWIRDTEAPVAHGWLRDWSQPVAAMTEDHAIIARVLKSATGQPIVIAGGHTAYGTAAAGEFVTSSAHLDPVLAGTSSEWNSTNIELVIDTTIVRGVRGSPRVSASHIW